MRTTVCYLIILLLLCNGTSLRGSDRTAQENVQQKTYTLNEVPNVKLADRNAYVSDPQQLLAPTHRDSINHLLRVLEDSTEVQCAVVVIPAIEEGTANDFAHQLFMDWGIGTKEKDNGLLILLLTAEGQREVVFETGYGIEATLPDALCKRIQTQTMLPYLKEGDYGAGLLSGIKDVCAVIQDEPQALALLSEDEDKPLSPEAKEAIGLGILAWCMLGIFLNYLPVSRARKQVSKGAKTPFEAFFSYNENSAVIGCFSSILFFPMLPVFWIIYFIYKAKFKRHALVCTACGSTMKLSKTVTNATTSSTGKKVHKAVCPSCGHTEEHIVILPIIPKNTGSSSGDGSGGSSWGSGVSGGSWGGGRSGGGGASTRF